MVMAVSSGATTHLSRGALTHQQSQQQLMVHTNMGSLRRLHSFPSESDNELPPPLANGSGGGGGVGGVSVSSNNNKPPVPERNADLITRVGHKRIPPPPPPRTSSRSPLASPTSPNLPQNIAAATAGAATAAGTNMVDNNVMSIETIVIGGGDTSSGDNSSGNESGNDHAQRQVALEMRHQELLKKQKLLQEQYQRLQQLSKIPSVDVSGPPHPGNESNIQQKIAAINLLACESMGSDPAAAAATAGAAENAAGINGVLNSDATGGVVGGVVGGGTNAGATASATAAVAAAANTTMTTKQVYETEIL